MFKSSKIRTHEYRSIYQLVGECRELGDDVTTWQRHLIEQMAGLTGGSIGFCGEFAGFRGMRPRYLGQSEWGWSDESDRSSYLANIANFAKNPESYSSMVAYHRKSVGNDGICLSRSQLFDDRSWTATLDYQKAFRPIRMKNALWCIRTLPGVAADESSGIHLLRSGDQDFGPRDRAIVEETHAALVPLIGGPLARFADPSPMALVPQVRRVLQCMLEGDSDKQIAFRMRLSTYTVNQYTKVVFRHFRVRGRTELMARWIRRRWSIRPGPPGSQPPGTRS
jgi:DNA-binding CsgD family transcriptional regulator